MKLTIDHLSAQEKDQVYRYLWAQHVREDVEARLENNDLVKGMSYSRRDQLVDKVVERYVYEGDYDCNTDYWSNIDALIKDILDDQKNKKVFYISFRTYGRYDVAVLAESREEAEEKATRQYEEADFGSLEDIDGEICYVATEDGEEE